LNSEDLVSVSRFGSGINEDPLPGKERKKQYSVLKDQNSFIMREFFALDSIIEYRGAKILG